jgi:hypothetical protein
LIDFSIKSSFFLNLEITLAMLFYLFGILGSRLRYKKYERYGKLDTFCMLCFTWGGNLMMLGLLNFIKFAFIPTLHMQIGRTIYYAGSIASSFIFLNKKYEEAKLANHIAMYILMSGMVFILGEALLFYYNLPLESIIMSGIGLVMVYIFTLMPSKNVVGILGGAALLILPLFSTVKEGGFNLEKLSAKRGEGIKTLISSLEEKH